MHMPINSHLSPSVFPTCDLPDDVLISVFSYVIDPVTLSHVSRSWRNLVLDVAILWSYVKVGGSRWLVEISLLRSQSTRLVIDAFLGNEESHSRTVLQNLALALKHAHRTDTLRITLQCSSLCTELQATLNDAVSAHQQLNLRTLELNFDTPALFDHLFNARQSTSSLRSLLLVNVGIPWSSPVLRNLSEIYIDSWEGHRRRLPPLPLSLLLNVLEQCPMLSKLHIGHTLVDDSDESKRDHSAFPVHSVVLPQLTEVVLRYTDIETSTSFVEAITTTGRTNWRISTKFPILEDSDPLLSLLQAINSQVGVLGDRNLCLSFSNDDMKLGIAGLVENSSSGNINGGQVKLRFKWPGTYRSTRLALPDTITETICLFEEVWQFGDVCRLHVEFANSGRRHGIVHRGYQCIDWNRLLRALPGLKYLSLDFSFLPESITEIQHDPLQDLKEEIMEGIINALTPSTSPNTISQQINVCLVCPSLVALDMIIGFRNVDRNLSICLRQRNEYGSQLSILRIKYARRDFISHEFKPEIMQAVKEAHFDAAQ